MFTLISALTFGCVADDDGASQTEGSGGKADGQCGDGTIATCEILPPTCPAGQVQKVLNSCYAGCVDADTCAASDTAEQEITSSDLVQDMIDATIASGNLQSTCTLRLVIEPTFDGYAHVELEREGTTKTIHLRSPQGQLIKSEAGDAGTTRTRYAMTGRYIEVQTFEDLATFAVTAADTSGTLRCVFEE
ncbi:MAG: hypothetical protein SFX73_34910 [Kofleriaceae bacterium]|nr:hypothetical protein [Kofleriaceae bacterium]